MAATGLYQVLLLDPATERGDASPYLPILRNTLESLVDALGLPLETLRFLGSHEFDSLDYKLPMVAVYFGHPARSPQIEAQVRRLRAQSTFILPLISDEKLARALLPEILLELNAVKPQPGDPALTSVATRLLEELHLERHRRMVFISYKRTDSTGVAKQLYHALHERGFEVFLDTFSIKGGRPFQKVLFDRIGDADLLILLDTQHIYESGWVQQELAQAELLGLTVLQLLWPDISNRFPGTELSETRYLDTAEFLRFEKPLTGEEQLQAQTLGEIIALAESLRARSLAARRRRVVEELYKHATHHDHQIRLQPRGYLELRPKGKRHYIPLYPVVGHPDAHAVQRVLEDWKKRRRPLLLFDNRGLWEPKANHLAWLNRYLPARTLPLTEVQEWLKKC